MRSILKTLSALLLSILVFSCQKDHDPPATTPVANAGADQTIQLSTTSFTLSGSGTTTNGHITEYLWTQLSGPNTASINNASSASTTVSGFIAGTYSFQLKVTNSYGLTAVDAVTITITSGITPVANAGADQTVQLPLAFFTLSGSGTTSAGIITGYQWSRISGPNTPAINNTSSASTSVSGFVAGTYQFQLQVTNSFGLSAKDTVVINVVGDNLEDSLIAWYKFTGGSLKDSSGKANDIVFNNATVTTDRFGNLNNAYLFNGSTSYMRVNNSTSLNPKLISIMAIVKPNGFYVGLCHGNNLLSKGTPDNVNGFYALRFINYNNPCGSPTNVDNESSYGVFGNNNPVGSGAESFADTSLIKANQWYNVIYTYDGQFAKLYINGLLKDVRTKIITSSGNTQDLFIGKHNDSIYPFWFNGVMDEIRIYEKALDQADVTALNKLKN